MQSKAIPLALAMLGIMVLCVVFIVLGATGKIAGNSTAVVILGILGLVLSGCFTVLFTYGYFKGRGR